MVVDSTKHMASNFAKLDKFEGVEFRRWRKKIHFLLSNMSVVYVLTTPISEDGLILNGMSDTLFDIYQNVESSKKLRDSLNAKYMAEDDQVKISLVQDNDKPKNNNVVGPSVVNMVELNNSIMYNDNKGKRKHRGNPKDDPNNKSKNDDVAWTCMLTKITNKPFQNVKRETKVLELIHSDLCDLHATSSLRNKNYFVTFIDDSYSLVVRLFDPKLKTLDEKGIECIFIGYLKHLKAFRFNVIEPNKFVSINSSIELGYAILDENRFSSLSRPSLRILNGIEDIGVTEVSDEVTSGVTEEMDVKTVILNGELDEEVYMNQPQGFIMPGNENKEFLSSRFSMKDMWEADVILVIRIKHESNSISISHSHYIENVLKKFSYFDCTLVSTPMETSEKLRPNNGRAVSQLKYYRVIGYLMYAMTCTRPDITFVMVKLSRQFVYKWLGILAWEGAISWASKKQTYITSSIMESEFVALAAAGKEAEWLRNLIIEIPL
ncbi:zinc finger, CCHC-type containing protein [Tanacetum coccineum]|uniref:Zinc finger, CCHC-type containing protein n=1 Tax=Tanacetum coccineum TaxID=301880 RepID=A0ABQ4Y7K0_9ASTR